MTDAEEIAIAEVTVKQFGRNWFSAYDSKGRFIAMGRSKREARDKALQRTGK